MLKRLLILTAVLLCARPALALEPDQMVLIVNAGIPASRGLAEFYAKARNIPPGRILAMKLPMGDEIGFEAYERDVVPVVRQFLRDNGLAEKVTCLVTFYGVPLRIVPGIRSPEERQEVAELQTKVPKLLGELRQTIGSMEEQARQFDASFAAGQGDDFEHLMQRADRAMAVLGRRVAATPDATQRQRRTAELVQFVKRLSGIAGVVRAFGPPDPASKDAAGEAKYKQLKAQVEAIVGEVMRLQQQRQDAAARARLRKLAEEDLGLFDSYRVMQSQAEYLNAAHSTAAFDSELALVWWTSYSRPGWQRNPLNFRESERPSPYPTLMVARLDAPQSGQVREMILASIKAERDGLKGKVVLDSRGISAAGDSGKYGNYGWYDQSIRNLADLLAKQTKLQVMHDASAQVLGANAAENVALYCGWYSHRKYVACCRYNLGAVGFHIASSELVNLHNEKETGWVHGLINDGVVASLGPVAEPYLNAFPLADEFFPLLLTGKLTLAEVYWKTVPMTSWMLGLVGDPLYTPYKTNPALKIEDLPERLRPIFAPSPTTRP